MGQRHSLGVQRAAGEGGRPKLDQQFAHEWACHLCLPIQEGADGAEIRADQLAGRQAGGSCEAELASKNMM